MTSFDELRELMARASFEVQFRTVASRSYYAVFNGLIPLLDKRGFCPSNRGDVHQQLIEFLKAMPEPVWRTAGHSRLPRLRRLRNRADYLRTTPFMRHHAAEAAADAYDFEQLLSSAGTGAPAFGLATGA